MNLLPTLKPGDWVELIAPASRCSDSQLQGIQTLLESWQLNCLIRDDIFAKDLLCANSDALRFQYLNEALHRPQTKAIICVRGGYGAMRLIPQLATVKMPTQPKIFVGMSDITCLHLYLQQHWGWATIHGSASADKLSADSLMALKKLLFAEQEAAVFHGKPLNQQAQEKHCLASSVSGGNLAIIQAGIGTNWQLDARNKLILLEEVNERGYRVDRMLQHLQQAQIFSGAKGIILGDFLEGNEPDGSSLIPPVLQRFAEQCEIPVVHIAGIGHGPTNYPIPLGVNVSLQLGDSPQLTCSRYHFLHHDKA